MDSLHVWIRAVSMHTTQMFPGKYPNVLTGVNWNGGSDVEYGICTQWASPIQNRSETTFSRFCGPSNVSAYTGPGAVDCGKCALCWEDGNATNGSNATASSLLERQGAWRWKSSLTSALLQLWNGRFGAGEVNTTGTNHPTGDPPSNGTHWHLAENGTLWATLYSDPKYVISGCGAAPPSGVLVPRKKNNYKFLGVLANRSASKNSSENVAGENNPHCCAENDPEKMVPIAGIQVKKITKTPNGQQAAQLVGMKDPVPLHCLDGPDPTTITEVTTLSPDTPQCACRGGYGAPQAVGCGPKPGAGENCAFCTEPYKSIAKFYTDPEESLQSHSVAKSVPQKSTSCENK